MDPVKRQEEEEKSVLLAPRICGIGPTQASDVLAVTSRNGYGTRQLRETDLNSDNRGRSASTDSLVTVSSHYSDFENDKYRPVFPSSPGGLNDRAFRPVLNQASHYDRDSVASKDSDSTSVYSGNNSSIDFDQVIENPPSYFV